MKSMPASLTTYIDSVRSTFEATLRSWVALPTVSASPEHKRDIQDATGTVVGFAKTLGAVAQAASTPGNPVITLSFGNDRSHPTVLVYNHLDVQPANEPEWLSPPFEMQIDSGTYRGRGTTDDKGPALTALLAARYAADNHIPLNIKFVWEFEEEIGSPNFESFTASNLDLLTTDSVVISDTIWISRDQPAIPFGLRGLLSARLTLETGTKDVHSGLTGGAARNPISEMCAVLAACYDVNAGQVRIPGFYEGIREVDSQELADFRSSGFRTEVFRAAHELKSLRSPDPVELMRRVWTEPTFEVHGIVGGYQGPGVKTSIPPRAEAKVSMRLVPDQSPRRVFQLLSNFVHEQNPDIEVTLDSTLAPFVGPRSGPYASAAADAIEHGFGKRPVGVREGGSIGAVVTMHDHLKAPIMFLGLSLPEHGYHAPNENFDWRQAAGGMRMFVKYFENISRL